MTLPSKRKSARLEIDAPHTKRVTIRAIEDQSVVFELRQKGGKSERETRTSGGKSMGGAISKCGDTVVDEVIDIQSPVAAAASTVLYSLQYGGDGGGYGDDSADSILLNTVKTSTRADDTLRYVPAWLAAKKKGRPKENVREKSVTDLIEESAKKKTRTRRIKLYCRICFKHNHTMVDCYQNPANEQQKTLEDVMEESDEDGEEEKA